MITAIPDSFNICGFPSSHKKILHQSESLKGKIFLLIDNPWTKCMVRQWLMGWSRKNAGWREGAIENDESSPAVCQGRRFLELLRMWSQLGCHPGEMNVIYDNSRNHSLIMRWGKSLYKATAELNESKVYRIYRWLLPTSLITYTCIVKHLIHFYSVW